MGGNFFFFLTILFFFFVLWVATGGPSRPISFSGPFITPITDVGQTQSGYGSLGDISASGGKEAISSNLQDVQNQILGLQKQVKSEQLFGTPSPYRGEVTLETGGIYETDPDQEYIALDVSSDATSDIDITGWRLVSTASSTVVTIPTAAPTLRLGSINSQQDIVVSPGDRVIITSGKSPVGTSFRENMCTGYLGQYQDFNPSLSEDCPSPSDEFDRFYPGDPQADDSCYAFVQDTGSCQVPIGTADKPTAACKSFVNNYLNYNGCVAAHSRDVGFNEHVWRVYLGYTKYDIWKQERDSIKLIDNSGKTVDLLSY